MLKVLSCIHLRVLQDVLVVFQAASFLYVAESASNRHGAT